VPTEIKRGLGRMTANPVVRSFLLACALAGFCIFALAFAPPPAPAQGSAKTDRSERKVIRLVNRIRGRGGLPRISRSPALMRSADYHSWDMLRADFFAHTSANGQSMSDRVRRFKPAARIGENLAWVPRKRGRNSASAVVRMWMESPGHRAVILNSGFRRIGIGRRTGSLGRTRAIVYTADFSSRR
jgi:uncharacterized protein YkwD